eukprot:TRINITY_DN48825_c0_g1_i1.p1 TRINITY_DN48825_c0_g1~~TRINITY_DN48825_c0_g1_i1.p1  ORF type:complete len:943 (-),score=121.40 TRINITY_DN48825_c0_g1_i1:61-2889(-)
MMKGQKIAKNVPTHEEGFWSCVHCTFERNSAGKTWCPGCGEPREVQAAASSHPRATVVAQCSPVTQVTPTNPELLASGRTTAALERQAFAPHEALPRSSAVSSSGSLSSVAPADTNRERLLKLTLEDKSQKAGIQPSYPPGPVIVKAVIHDSWAYANGIMQHAAMLSINNLDPEEMTKVDFIAMLKKRPLTLTLAVPLPLSEGVSLGMTYDFVDNDVIVQEVSFGGWAHQNRLEPGFRILAVSGEPVGQMDPSDFAMKIESRPILLTIVAPKSSTTNGIGGPSADKKANVTASRLRSQNVSRYSGVVTSVKASEDARAESSGCRAPTRHRQAVDVFEYLTFSMREVVFAFTGRKWLIAAVCVRQNWHDAVASFLLSNRAERALSFAYHDLFFLPIQWVVLHMKEAKALKPFSRSAFGFAMFLLSRRSPIPFLREVRAKLLAIFDLVNPDGTVTRQSYGEVIDTLWFSSMKIVTRLCSVYFDDRHRDSPDSVGPFSHRFFNAIMRRLDVMPQPRLLREPTETLMDGWAEARYSLFNLFDWHAGGTGVVTRADAERALDAFEAIFADGSRETMAAALDQVSLLTRRYCQTLSLASMEDLVGGFFVRSGMMLSIIIRHIHDLCLPEVICALYQHDPSSRIQAILKRLSKMFQGEAVSRAEWLENVEALKSLDADSVLSDLLRCHTFDPGILGDAYVYFLKATGGGIDEATFLARLEPSIKKALDALDDFINRRLTHVLEDFIVRLWVSTRCLGRRHGPHPEGVGIASRAAKKISSQLRQTIKEQLTSFISDIASRLFRILDSDNDGFIDGYELDAGRRVLCADTFASVVQGLFDIVDSDNDGVLNLRDLTAFWGKVTDTLICILQMSVETLGVAFGQLAKEFLRVAVGAGEEVAGPSELKTTDCGVFVVASCLRVPVEVMCTPLCLDALCRALSVFCETGRLRDQ